MQRAGAEPDGWPEAAEGNCFKGARDRVVARRAPGANLYNGRLLTGECAVRRSDRQVVAISARRINQQLGNHEQTRHLLAGGRDALAPITAAVSKQLVPVYDKPMIYYPLSVLMLAGIREVLVITTPHDQPAFQRLLGDGSQWGMEIQYAVQPDPGGLAQAYLIGADFVGEGPSALVLGDNIFYGHGFGELLAKADGRSSGATVFGYYVSDPTAYGVVSFDGAAGAETIEEKPAAAKVELCGPALFLRRRGAADRAGLKPGVRGELETRSQPRHLEAGSSTSR